VDVSVYLLEEFAMRETALSFGVFNQRP